jgi:chromosome segregation and condensation protein ScpB
MNPPNPIFVLKAGVKNLIDFAALWHIALCGLTGAKVADLADALGVSANTLYTSLIRLEGMRLVVQARNADKPGHPATYVCSRLGYRLMTGHLKEKPGQQTEMLEVQQAEH